MQILVTGGRGFIGRHVVECALGRGWSVRVLGRPGGSTARKDVDLVEHDLRDREGLASKLRGVDAVVHCVAAMGGSSAEQESVTLDGTRHLLEAMRESGVGRIVHLSTFAVYDYLRMQVGETLTEASPIEAAPDSRSPYSGVKLRQETLVRRFGESEGWHWTVLRPGIVLGKGHTWFYHLGARLDPQVWLTLAGRGALPLAHVQGCAEAAVLALETGRAKDATINIVDDALPSRSRYVRELQRRLELDRRVIDVPWSLLQPPAAAMHAAHRHVLRGRGPLPDLFRPARLAARCKPVEYSNALAKSLLDWSPPFGFEAALAQCFESP